VGAVSRPCKCHEPTSLWANGLPCRFLQTTDIYLPSHMQQTPGYHNLKKTNFNTGFHYCCVPQLNIEVKIPWDKYFLLEPLNSSHSEQSSPTNRSPTYAEHYYKFTWLITLTLLISFLYKSTHVLQEHLLELLKLSMLFENFVIS
jgi:hypothetical protein